MPKATQKAPTEETVDERQQCIDEVQAILAKYGYAIIPQVKPVIDIVKVEEQDAEKNPDSK